MINKNNIIFTTILIVLTSVSIFIIGCAEETPAGPTELDELLLLYSDFENYDSFDPPPPLDSIEQLHWYLESSNADAVIDTTISRSGNKSVKLIGSVQEGSAIACGVPDEPACLLKKSVLKHILCFQRNLRSLQLQPLV